MKEKLNIKAISSILPILGIAILLLISPCKVRNSIEAELGVPQTEVANKNKTTVNSSSCNTLEVSQVASIIAKSIAQISPALGENIVDFDFNKIDFTNKSPNFHTTRNQLVSSVPLYILHRNFKVYPSSAFS